MPLFMKEWQHWRTPFRESNHQVSDVSTVAELVILPMIVSPHAKKIKPSLTSAITTMGIREMVRDQGKHGEHLHLGPKEEKCLPSQLHQSSFSHFINFYWFNFLESYCRHWHGNFGYSPKVH